MSNQDTASIPIYRRRRIAKTKHILKTCNAHEYPSDWVIDNINELPFRNKGETYEHERSKNLSEHSIAQKQVFDEGDADSGIYIEGYS